MDEQLFPQQPMTAAPAGGPRAGNPAAGLPSIGTVASLASQVTALATRVKLAEERYQNLSKRNQITEGSLLSFEKDIKVELRVMTKQTVELHKRLAEMNAKIDAIMGELGNVVRKPEFSTAERYVELWQPMQFITRDEAMRLIAEASADARRAADKAAAQARPEGDDA